MTPPVALLLFGLFALPLRFCEAQSSRAVDPDVGDTAEPAPIPSRKAPLEPLHVAVLDENEHPPTFVLRGGPLGPSRLVFLHGMCGHGMGYAQSFQYAAAKKGTLIAPQADVVCGKGPWAKWSLDIEALDARIVAAFRKLGHAGSIDDVAVIGYSQGATRAEALARRFPQRYTRLISIGAPEAPSGRGLKRVRAAVMMAGERDRRDQMHAGVRSMTAHGIPSTFILIPEARHGAMGPTPEKTMGEALDWLWRNSKPGANE
ncbi:MAG TPA: alpha/beta hydrolase [Polyangiaceae bacterium]